MRFLAYIKGESLRRNYILWCYLLLFMFFMFQLPLQNSPWIILWIFLWGFI